MIKNFINPKGHQNPISGSKVTAILLKGWILPIGGVSLEKSAPAACAAGWFFFYRCVHLIHLVNTFEILILSEDISIFCYNSAHS